MQIISLYIVTLVTFLTVDFFGLTYLIRPVFERHIGGLLLDDFRLGPALVFYLFYIGGVVLFVSLPALRSGALTEAFLMGLVLGALAYGTYEFSNFATLKSWHWQMVAVDLTWGAALTGVSAWAGVWITRMVFAV